jgi:hypothetical protein
LGYIRSTSRVAGPGVEIGVGFLAVFGIFLLPSTIVMIVVDKTVVLEELL